MTTYYILDGDEIINAVETDTLVHATEVAKGMIDGERLRVTKIPTRRQLEGYRYWRERP